MTITANKLASQWTENTGRHMLDSGSAYGRNWERNQGKTVEQFTEGPGVRIDADYGAVINTFAYLLDHIRHTEKAAQLTEQFREWVGMGPIGESYFNAHGSDWLEALGATDINGFNTYNWENLLDSTLQGETFTLEGEYGPEYYVMLQYHGGCDIRGGYTDYVVYETCEDQCWLAMIGEAYISCADCDFQFDIQSGAHIENVEGTDKNLDQVPTECVECGSQLIGTYSGSIC